ncbi:MAG TPA: hypothetical protein VE999_21810 [Gemmataceae bacterium]|nr:hypothetical protein [Gemmataceae bacterium]
MRKPIGERDFLVSIGAENFEEDEIGIAGILDIMAERFPDVSDVAGIEIGD